MHVHWKDKCINNSIHFSRLFGFHLWILFLQWTRVNPTALSGFYTFTVLQSFLIELKHPREQGQSPTTFKLCFYLCTQHTEGLCLLIDFFFLVNLSFRFDPATYKKKKVEKKAFSEIKQLNHKMFFSKNNTFPQTLEAELCVFSSPINESKMLLPPPFILPASCLCCLEICGCCFKKDQMTTGVRQSPWLKSGTQIHQRLLTYGWESYSTAGACSRSMNLCDALRLAITTPLVHPPRAYSVTHKVQW